MPRYGAASWAKSTSPCSTSRARARRASSEKLSFRRATACRILTSRLLGILSVTDFIRGLPQVIRTIWEPVKPLNLMIRIARRNSNVHPGSSIRRRLCRLQEGRNSTSIIIPHGSKFSFEPVFTGEQVRSRFRVRGSCQIPPLSNRAPLSDGTMTSSFLGGLLRWLIGQPGPLNPVDAPGALWSLSCSQSI